MLYAVIESVDLTDELNPIYEFTLTDEEEDGEEIAVRDKISLSHAAFVDRFAVEPNNAYYKMINAIVHFDSSTLVGTEFASVI